MKIEHCKHFFHLLVDSVYYCVLHALICMAVCMHASTQDMYGSRCALFHFFFLFQHSHPALFPFQRVRHISRNTTVNWTHTHTSTKRHAHTHTSNFICRWAIVLVRLLRHSLFDGGLVARFERNTANATNIAYTCMYVCRWVFMFVCDLICMKSPTLPVNAERSLLDSCSDLELHEVVGVKIGVGVGSFSVPFCCQAVQLFQLNNFNIF